MSHAISIWQRLGLSARVGLGVLDLVQRRATAPFRTLPRVFILGGTKCGSSTLARMLWQHPAHVASLTKELMYLQKLPGFQSNYEYAATLAFLWGRYRNGHAAYCEHGYRKFFPLRWTMVLRELQRHSPAITSDCDPFNLYCPAAMRRIAQLDVAPKFIVSLRDPVARTYSDYNMHRRDPHDPRSFRQCIEDELSRRESRFRKRFINQSIYAPHLERWFSCFPRESFLIMRAEDLFADGADVASRIFAFLGLPPVALRVTPQNVGAYPDFMDAGVRALLRDHFRPHNERLYALLDRDMGWQ